MDVHKGAKPGAPPAPPARPDLRQSDWLVALVFKLLYTPDRMRSSHALYTLM
jgi:hypothetical protein